MTEQIPTARIMSLSFRRDGAAWLSRLGGLAFLLSTVMAAPSFAQDAAAATAEAQKETSTEADEVGTGDVGPGDAGAYLAARIAATDSDFREGQRWFTRALLADPANPLLQDGLILSHIGSGNLEPAARIAEVYVAQGGRSIGAAVALLVQAVQAKDFDAILARQETLRIGNLLDDLTYAWAEFGKGRMSEAVAAFDKIAENEGLKAFGLYHKALALAAVGDFESADAIMAGKSDGPLLMGRRGVVAHAQILSQLERNDDAIAMLDRMLASESDPEFEALQAQLMAGETLPFTILRNAADGVAETFFAIAVALSGEAEDGYTLLYARAALALNPSHSEALLFSAGLLERLGQLELAGETYAALPKDHPAFYAAEVGRAETLFRRDLNDEAVEALAQLTQALPQSLLAAVAYADGLRREERWQDAVTAYDQAVALIEEPQERHWPIFYSRAVAHERSESWPEAERDFRKALELNPNQPQVLNYLGYSFVDRGENLEEALDLIKRAVSLRPDAGYIIDSLAWALYRLGQFDEALPHMERASVLEPVDPVVTDHLGDVYWKVGRTNEAHFQWRRALSFEPTEKDAERIRRKLELGLDNVLAEEAKAEKP